MNKKYRHGQLKSIQRVECEVPKRGLFISYINKVLCIYSLCKAHICHGYHGLYPWRKICHLEKFQISVKNLYNLRSFIDIYAVFVQNLCGEKFVWRKSVWRKNDKYEVWTGCGGDLAQAWPPCSLRQKPHSQIDLKKRSLNPKTPSFFFS